MRKKDIVLKKQVQNYTSEVIEEYFVCLRFAKISLKYAWHRSEICLGFAWLRYA